MANWATAAEVLAYTGATVTDAQIDISQGLIDVYSNITTDDLSSITDRDIRLLKQALAYQTVWQVNQIDVLTRTDVTAVDQDGLKFTPANAESLVLAPLAKRCLDRLSWRKARSLRIRPGRNHRFASINEVEDAWFHDEGPTNFGWVSV